MSNTKSSKKQNSLSYNKYRVNRPIDIVNIVYLIFISTVFCFYMHDKYFDITGTRANTFIYSGLVYIILILVAFILEAFMLKYFSPEDTLFYKDNKIIEMPELWMGLFMLANTFAWCMSDNKTGSWTGETGRWFGLKIILVIGFVFIFLCREACVHYFVYIGLSLMAAVAYGIAILQHYGFDPFKLRERVVPKQKEKFISTFGNINTYGAYLAIVIPIFAAAFVISKKLWVRVVAGVMLVLSGMAIIPAKSDNVYLGIAAAFLILFYVAVMNKRFTEYVFGVLLLIIGLYIMALLNSMFKGSQAHINGIAEIIENPSIMLIAVGVITVILVATLVFRSVNYELYKNLQGPKMLLICTALFVIGAVAGVIAGIKTKNSMFVFNDEWGTYRGYIWRRSWDNFKDGTLLNKIFGYGNETIAALMKRFYAEMVEVTGFKYDNAHNELLQYLVTTGLFGLISYLGMVFSSFIYMGRRIKGDPIAAACIAGGVGYFAQSLVNLNQPITAPLFFVLLAAGVGHVRYRNQGYGKYNI